jgi:hypothetical protein
MVLDDRAFVDAEEQRDEPLNFVGMFAVCAFCASGSRPS